MCKHDATGPANMHITLDKFNLETLDTRAFYLLQEFARFGTLGRRLGVVSALHKCSTLSYFLEI